MVSPQTGQASPGALVDTAGTIGGRAHVRPRALVGQALVDGGVDGVDDPLGAVHAELAGAGERGELGPVAHLVGQPPAQAGDAVLVAQEAVEAHRVLGEQRGQLVRGHVHGLRPERSERGTGEEGVRLHAPDPGLAFGPGLGEEQRAPVLEAPAGLAATRLGGLLLVLLQPPTLHQVHDEGQRRELEQQVLASPADLLQGMADRLLGGRDRRLEGGERERLEAGQAAAGVSLRQPFGVRLDLGQLGHGRSSGSPSRDARR